MVAQSYDDEPPSPSGDVLAAIRPRSVRKHRLLGDVAVVRTKGEGGVSWRHQRVFRSLALYELGDVSFGYSTDPTFLGQIRALPRDWIEVVPFVASASAELERLANEGVQRAAEVRPMRPELFVDDDGARVAAELPLSNGEFARIDKSEETYSIAWSTALPVATVFDRLLTIARGHNQSFSEGYLIQSGLLIRGQSAELTQMIENNDGDISFARLDGFGLSLAWRSRVGLAEEFGIELHECFVVLGKSDEKLTSKLMYESATPAVGKNAVLILRQLGRAATRA